MKEETTVVIARKHLTGFVFAKVVGVSVARIGISLAYARQSKGVIMGSGIVVLGRDIKIHAVAEGVIEIGSQAVVLGSCIIGAIEGL